MPITMSLTLGNKPPQNDEVYRRTLSNVIASTTVDEALEKCL